MRVLLRVWGRQAARAQRRRSAAAQPWLARCAVALMRNLSGNFVERRPSVWFRGAIPSTSSPTTAQVTLTRLLFTADLPKGLLFIFCRDNLHNAFV